MYRTETAGGAYGRCQSEAQAVEEKPDWGISAWEPNFDGILGPVQLDSVYIFMHTTDRELLISELGERAADGLILASFDAWSEANFYQANGFFSND